MIPTWAQVLWIPTVIGAAIGLLLYCLAFDVLVRWWMKDRYYERLLKLQGRQSSRALAERISGGDARVPVAPPGGDAAQPSTAPGDVPIPLMHTSIRQAVFRHRSASKRGDSTHSFSKPAVKGFVSHRGIDERRKRLFEAMREGRS